MGIIEHALVEPVHSDSFGDWGTEFRNPSGNAVSITEIHIGSRVSPTEVVIIGVEPDFTMQLEAFTTVRPNVLISPADGPTGSQHIW